MLVAKGDTVAPSKEQVAKQKAIAKEFIAFRTKHLFSQVKLAEALGVSRRAIQYAEYGPCIPLPDTLKKFRALKNKYESEGKR